MTGQNEGPGAAEVNHRFAATVRCIKQGIRSRSRE
jgi:hypothetical protein